MLTEAPIFNQDSLCPQHHIYYRKSVLQVLSLSLVLVCSLPVPETEDISEDSYDDEYYGDYDSEAANATPAQNGLEDILKLGSGLAEGLLTLLGEKVKIINGLLADKVGELYSKMQSQ